MVATAPRPVKPPIFTCYYRGVTAYQAFLQHINDLSEGLNAYYAKHLACRAGCSGCCQHHLAVFPVEADFIAAALAALPLEKQQQIAQQARDAQVNEAHNLAVACPLLVEDRCSIYHARPVICRTQGLPLLLEAEDGAPEIDFCPLNFTAPDALNDLSEDKLVPLEKINLQLAVLNLQHCRAQGVPDEQSGQRLTMSELILRTPSNSTVTGDKLTGAK